VFLIITSSSLSKEGFGVVVVDFFEKKVRPAKRGF